MSDFDLLVSVTREVRLMMIEASQDGAEPSVASLLKEVNKDANFQGEKLSQAMVRGSMLTSSVLSRVRAPTLAFRPSTDQKGGARDQEGSDDHGGGAGG